MVTFLFWNVNRKPIEATVAQLAHEHGVDVLMLAECVAAPGDVLRALNGNGRAEYHFAPGRGPCTRIATFTQFPGGCLAPVSEDDRWTVRRLALPGVDDVLVAIAHLPSKVHATRGDQEARLQHLARSLRDAENEAGHQRALVVGDLNVDPFEDGVCSADGLHAVMTREVASRQSRVYLDQERLFLYNPMWGRLGDATPGPPGTHYQDRGHVVTRFWHTFDQVLLRPQLLDRFDEGALKVLTGVGDADGPSLLSASGRPAVSDHLPLIFTLDL
jgi:hypothetical protein